MVMVSQTGSVGFIAFLVCSVLVGSVISLEPSSEVQIEALKAFKNSITNDPFGALLDWNDTNLHHCNWSGIACDTSSNQVISVSFPDKQLKEFAYMRKVTTKVDVFSFGIIVMELLTKRRPTGLTQEDGLSITLPQLVERALANGINRLLHVVDPLLASQVSKEQEMVEALLKLALSCTCTAPEDRPDMDEILSSILKLSKHRIASKQ